MSRLIRIGDLALAYLSWGAFALALAFILAKDASVALDTPARVRAYIRAVEFDFVDWTLDALGFKARQSSVDEQAFLSNSDQTRRVRDYFDLIFRLEGVRREVEKQYADPAVKDPAAETAGLRAMEADLRAQAGKLQPLAESILQEQISVILAEQGLVLGGQPVPPVSFHFTALPYALIVSPRAAIRQDANLDVSGDLTLEQQVALEERVARELDVSTLIVGLGGIGTYPTMVLQHSDLNWIVSVTAHEWTHNYLTLHPLGLNYETSPELRTMNETTAEIVGDEIGAMVMKRYYPDLASPPSPFRNLLRREQPAGQTQRAPDFEFRTEMHATRVRVDELLAQGKAPEAEAYMEERRKFFWDHGYQIRRLNQAYFAFYGAYAADGGAPGADPVGPAVRLLRRRSPNLKYFLDTMAWFTSFEQLKGVLGLSNQ